MTPVGSVFFFFFCSTMAVAHFSVGKLKLVAFVVGLLVIAVLAVILGGELWGEMEQGFRDSPALVLTPPIS